MSANSTILHLEKSVSFFAKRPTVILVLIGILSLLLRFAYFDPNLPLTVDALKYFFYAFDVSYLGHLPSNYSPANNGWPIFVSFFFSIFHFDNVISYMQLQRILSIVISSAVIIPVYLLCRRYFEPKYSLVGAAIIGFEPRLVQNSLLGISDSLYILIVAFCFYLVLSSSRMIYISFAIAALGTMVRAEGLFLFIALSVVFLIRNRKQRTMIPKYLIAVAVFALILLPMVFFKIGVMENDAIFMRTSSGISNIVKSPEETGGYSGLPFILRGVENFPKYLGWDLIPVFIFFVPIGFFLLLKRLDSDRLTPIIGCIVMSVPAFYVYSIPLPDTRYLFYLYPLFCVFSLFTVQRFTDRFQMQNLVLILIILGVFLAASMFLDYIMDLEHEKNALSLAVTISGIASGVNEYAPESRYLQATEIPDKTADFRVLFSGNREDRVAVIDSIPHKLAVIPVKNYDSIQKFIEDGKEKGLSHLVIDDNNNRPIFLKEVFANERDYPYLIKEYQIISMDSSYYVKIFRIDYGLFEKWKDNPE